MLESEDSEESSDELETTAPESEPTTTESETKTAKRKNLRENLTLKLSLQFYILSLKQFNFRCHLLVFSL